MPQQTDQPKPESELDDAYQAWSTAAAAVLAKSRRVDVDELPGADEVAEDADLAVLRERFLASPWASRTPLAVEVDVDAHPELAARYEVLSMPTFVVFRDGAPVGRLVGARPRARFVSDVEQALA